MFDAFGGSGPSWEKCARCDTAFPPGSDHRCNEDRVARLISERAALEAAHLDIEMYVWMTKTNEGKFEVFYAERQRRQTLGSA